jgi:integrase/recombinase XerD
MRTGCPACRNETSPRLPVRRVAGGLRRAEIAALKVGDLHQNRGFASLRVMRKGGRRDALAINPQTAARLRAYLETSEHGADVDGPLFRPVKHNGKRQDERRGMDPDAIDRGVRKYAGELGLDRGYSAHTMRATFITTALVNGAQLEDVQKVAGHRDPGTTKLYDRRGYDPEKAASFFFNLLKNSRDERSADCINNYYDRSGSVS